MIGAAPLLLLAALAAAPPADGPDRHPLSAEERARLEREARETIADVSRRIAREPGRVELYSRRGDARFFLGEFQQAVADYDRMVELDPELETSHWRRGIACFYAEDYCRAARQFEVYHTFDNVDRENGIWRFLSQVKADGLDKARAGLLKYEKDDREPFPSVYRLFADQTTPADVVDAIRTAELDATERNKRLFYAHLYAGLNCAVEDRPDEALQHLRQAVANPWGRDPRSGYGPHYMWHVGRLHYERLLRDRMKRNGPER